MTNFTLIGVITDVRQTKLDDDDYVIMLDVTSKDAIYRVYVDSSTCFMASFHVFSYYYTLKRVKVLITGQIEVGSNGDMQLWATHIAPMDQD